MSKKIIPAVLTEGPKPLDSGALTDDELNVVSGGARTNGDNPAVKAAMDAFVANGGQECFSTSKSTVCF